MIKENKTRDSLFALKGIIVMHHHVSVHSFTHVMLK